MKQDETQQTRAEWEDTLRQFIAAPKPPVSHGTVVRRVSTPRRKSRHCIQST